MDKLLVRTANHGRANFSLIPKKPLLKNSNYCTLASPSSSSAPSSFTSVNGGTLPSSLSSPSSSTSTSSTQKIASRVNDDRNSRTIKHMHKNNFKTLDKTYPYVPPIPDMKGLSDTDAQIAYDLWVDELRSYFIKLITRAQTPRTNKSEKYEPGFVIPTNLQDKELSIDEHRELLHRYCEVCEFTNGREGLMGVLKEAKSLEEQLIADDVMRIVPALFATRIPSNFDLAHRVVLTCSERDVRLYNLLLEDCVEKNNLNLFDSVVKEMEMEKLEYDDETYRLVITAMALRNDAAGLRSFIDKMQGYISNAVVGNAERLASVIEANLAPSPFSSSASAPSAPSPSEPSEPSIPTTPSTPSVPATPAPGPSPSLSPSSPVNYTFTTKIPEALKKITSKPTTELMDALDKMENPNFNQLLKIYNPDDVAQWYTLRDHLKEKEYVAEVADYNSYLRYRVRTWKPAEVEAFVSDMKAHDVNPDTETYDLQILNLARHTQWEAVYKMVKEMSQKRLQPTENTFLEMLKWCNVTKNYTFAGKTWRAIKKFNLVVSSQFLVELLETAKKLNDQRLKLEILKTLRARGDYLSISNYMVLLADQIESKDKAGVMKVWDEMKEKGMVDTLSYTSMVSYAGRQGNVALCDQLLQEMEAKKLDMQVPLNSVMLSAAKRNDTEWYSRTLGQVQQAGIALTPSGYKAMLLRAIKDNNEPEVERLTAEMQEKNIPLGKGTPKEPATPPRTIQPKTQAQTPTPEPQVAESDIVRKKIQKILASYPNSLQVLQEFIPSSTGSLPIAPSSPIAPPPPSPPPSSSSSSPDSVPSLKEDHVDGTENLKVKKLIDIFSFCLSNEDLEGCARVWEEMDDKVRDAKYSMYIKMMEFMSNKKDLDSALSIFVDMRNAGFLPPSSTYATLIKDFVVGREYARAYYIFMEARLAGVTMDADALDADTFNAVAQIAATHEDPQALAEIIERMEASGVRVNESTLAAIARSCAVRGDTEGCIALVTEMQQLCGKGDAEFYNFVADTLNSYGNKKELDELLVLMKKDGVTWHGENKL